MKRRTAITIAATGLFALLAIAGPAIAANSSVKISEADERYSFSPRTTYVNVGESVTWTNDTDAPHNVTSDSGDELVSDNFGEDETFDHAFSVAGTFDYHCTIHGYMTGSVVVLAEGVTPPPTSTAPASSVPSEPSWPGIVVVALIGLAAGGLALRRFRAAD
jgi:plastocyanin